jgi:hypothetical protein
MAKQKTTRPEVKPIVDITKAGANDTRTPLEKKIDEANRMNKKGLVRRTDKK